MYEQACGHDEAANRQVPIAVAFWIIPMGFRRAMFKLNAKSDTDSLSY